MVGPPFAQELRAKKIGHVLVNTTTDPPWSQYFCCLVASTKDFVRQHPVATKRALRAIVKGADLCALDPKRVARLIADRGLARYDYTLQSLQEIPYGKWRGTTLRIHCVSTRCGCTTSDSSRAVRKNHRARHGLALPERAEERTEGLSLGVKMDGINGMSKTWSRRRFLAKASALGVAGFLDVPRAFAADPPPETTRIRLMKASLCTAPAYIAEELLRAEGFSDVQYFDDDQREIGTSKLVAIGAADFNMSFGLTTLIRVEAGEPVVMLAGVTPDATSYLLRAVRSIGDLRGCKVVVPGIGSTHHRFLSVMASYVGLDPRREISWVTLSREDGMRQLAEGKVDAYLGFPPDPQELRAKGVGHVVLNSSTDKPWSQYFCCMVIANSEFVRRNPIATKRALRALLKATDLCATQPERSAQFLVDRGYVQSREYALQTLNDVSYRKWREYNPEDSVRFFALRLHDVGLVKSSPQKLIARGTDWRFLNELKQELKA